MRIDSTGFHRSLSCNDFFQPGPNKMRRVNQFTRVGEVMGCFPEERGGGFPSFGSGSVKRISASTVKNEKEYTFYFFSSYRISLHLHLIKRILLIVDLQLIILFLVFKNRKLRTMQLFSLIFT